ncbi:MAG: thiamine phosphate synthase [Paracoccaceae bacterium]
MAETERPQIYLITPPELDLQTFPDVLSAVLDSTDVACVRLALSTTDETLIAKSADALRALTHERDIALVIETHMLLVERLGLDGVHLTDGAKSVRYMRKELGQDAIVGTFCGTSRHEGLTAGEAGADYVSFGPVVASDLGDGSVAETDLFNWWSEVVEVPIVAEGNLNEEIIRTLTPMTDFFGFGTEIWASDDPVAALTKLTSVMASES